MTPRAKRNWTITITGSAGLVAVIAATPKAMDILDTRYVVREDFATHQAGLAAERVKWKLWLKRCF